MNNLIFYLFFLFTLIQQKDCSTPHNYAYKAAVLEYFPEFFPEEEADSVFGKNVPNYLKYIKQAAIQYVDIIVFPEAGLTGLMNRASINRKSILPFGTEIPQPADRISPCKSQSNKWAPHLRDLSCAAAKHQIYVVVNLVEIYNCSGQTKCPKDNVFIYNCNVVFDRSGIVIAKYRKYNLYAEPVFNITNAPEIVTFDTDFNVTLGMFICADILFQKPALELVRKKNVHDIIFSTAWHSELPSLTAVQTQMGWAYGNDVTLLASGYNNPKEERGSGIYFGRMGALAQTFPLSKRSEMLIAEIPKSFMYEKSVENLKENLDLSMDEVQLWQEDLSAYTTHIVKEGSFRKKVCHQKLCCQFEIESAKISTSNYVYRIVVFDGVRTYPQIVQFGFQACGVVNCLDKTLESCALRNRTTETGVIFTKIQIRGNFVPIKDTFQWPSTVKSNLLPLDSDFFMYTITRNGIEMRLTNKVNDLLTFGIVGRNFTLDKRLDRF